MIARQNVQLFGGYRHAGSISFRTTSTPYSSGKSPASSSRLLRNSVLDRAKNLRLARQVSFWDAMILSACLDAGVYLLLSEDIPGGEMNGISVVNPFG
jgi:hypothetical protein